MRDFVYVVGHGKLASKIERDFLGTAQRLQCPVTLVANWDNLPSGKGNAFQNVLVHCGSGRQLPDVLTYCSANHVPLIQCSTGITYPSTFTNEPEFALVEAPNLSIPIIKFLYLMEAMGPLFHGYDISITESHQSTKKSVPGTAMEMARLLGVEQSNIKSIRDAGVQRSELGIPEENLGQHAIHIIDIFGDGCEITMRTQVYGLDTYLAGLVKIVHAIDRLSPGRHKLTDLVRQHVF